LYQGSPLDTQTQYVRDFLRFLGISDVEFIYAEGLAIDAARRESAIGAAHAQIAQLVEKRAAA
jgi:FMN-dependent NADH-azoreductase